MFEKKRMTETTEIAEYCVQSGMVKSSRDVIVLESNINRICAPQGSERLQQWPIILWTKDTEQDNNPQPGKIVCFIFGSIKCCNNVCISLGLSFMDLRNFLHISSVGIAWLPVRTNQI